MSSALFQPFTIKGLTLPNRIVMAPMTRSFSPGGVPTADVAAYYERRARGEVGLILTEGTVIPHRKVSSNDANVPHFYGDEALSGWKNVVSAVHGAGGKIAPQIWHVGMIRNADKMWNPEDRSAGPSGLVKPGRKTGEPMSEEDVADAVAAYAASAKYAKDLGFDALELHGAHGYLIDQFFWEGTNERGDTYGGDMVARTRFAADVVKAVRAAVGPDFVVILRYSQWKQQDYTARLAPSPDELGAFLTPLADAGVDVFHCSTRRFWEPEFEGSDMNLAGWTKKLTGVPTITVGSIGLKSDFLTSFTSSELDSGTLDQLENRVAKGEFDLVAVGRALIANPNWATMLREGTLSQAKEYTPETLGVLV